MNSRSLFNIGDRVKFKTLERLKEEFGDPIQVKSGWLDIFNQYAGEWYTVINVGEFTGGGLHYSYQLDGASYWWFSEEIFETEEIIPEHLVISFEEATGMQ